MTPSNEHQLTQPILGQLNRFLSIGECMVEMAPIDQAGDFRMGFAGDTFNTSWYMRTLRSDVETRYFTRVGTDAVSQSMLDMMSGAGVNTSFIAQDPVRSVGLYLISLKDGERSFSYWRDQSAARKLAQDADLLHSAMQDADLIYFSGISLAILDTKGRQTLLHALHTARANGKRIAFDSNLRPRLWTNNDEMTTTVMQAAAVSDIILPSYDDEADFFGDANIEATGNRYLNAGAKTIVIKNGAGAVHYIHNGVSHHINPPAVGEIIDTTSAGDSFNAGFFAGLDRATSMEDLIKSASQVAGQVIGRKGALVPLDLTKITT
ncbi:2-keto-3-deoxygluconate kinase [Litoreibacter meonggei]|uniref:2-keto-3-deoxygluconate kinase n=1 Tax=Litoreibacter meonggei TaxID=1049199 RepID=A0A497VBF0_9RHOB|nr:sugar kinase [Litoreibacter meonggei]RLJ40911.1 2-keto-3-deoxygluconate kinase [Litoreibacter meonggei]